MQTITDSNGYSGPGGEPQMSLTNGVESFSVGVTLPDDGKAVEASDARGGEYVRCDIGCDHSQSPAGTVVWHDRENTETLWQVEPASLTEVSL